MLDKLKRLFATNDAPQELAQPVEKLPLVTIEHTVVKTPAVEPNPKKPRKPRKSKEKVVEKQLTEKELATLAGEPYVSIVKVNIDPDNINAGEFELDWNSKFAANLARAGYQKKPGESEDVIVDRWFQAVCRNVALELYEQEVADPSKRGSEDTRHIRSRDLGNGRSEIS